MIDSQLLEILCCPETHQPVLEAEKSVIDRLNAGIAAGSIRNRAGQTVTEQLDRGLMRQDGKFLYPVRQEIPIMLIDEAIPLALQA